MKGERCTMPLRLHLYWLEPKSSWKFRGYANNRQLWIDFSDKSCILRTDYMCGNFVRSVSDVRSHAQQACASQMPYTVMR